MTSLHRRFAVAIALMAICTPAVLLLHYNVPPPARLDELRRRVPTSIPPWYAVRERGPTKTEVEILETEAILTRTYARASDPLEVDFSVVYAQDNRRVAHPPEICYKGSGWGVEYRRVSQFEVAGRPFRANRLLLLRGGKRLLVLYWFKGGERYYASYFRMQWGIIWTHFRLRSSSSGLLRVSVESPSRHDDERLFGVLEEFAARAIPAVTGVLP